MLNYQRVIYPQIEWISVYQPEGNNSGSGIPDKQNHSELHLVVLMRVHSSQNQCSTKAGKTWQLWILQQKW